MWAVIEERQKREIFLPSSSYITIKKQNNQLFRAVSIIIYNNEKFYKLVKLQLIGHLMNGTDLYPGHSNEQFQMYIGELLKDDTPPIKDFAIFLTTILDRTINMRYEVNGLVEKNIAKVPYYLPINIIVMHENNWQVEVSEKASLESFKEDLEKKALFIGQMVGMSVESDSDSENENDSSHDPSASESENDEPSE